jgi:transposase
MPKGRPLAPLSIAEEQRKQLLSWSRRRTTAPALALRARIVLLAADGLSNTAVAAQVSTTTLHTAGKWRQRFLASGIDGCSTSSGPAPRANCTMSRWSMSSR